MARKGFNSMFRIAICLYSVSLSNSEVKDSALKYTSKNYNFIHPSINAHFLPSKTHRNTGFLPSKTRGGVTSQERYNYWGVELARKLHGMVSKELNSDQDMTMLPRFHGNQNYEGNSQVLDRSLQPSKISTLFVNNHGPIQQEKTHTETEIVNYDNRKIGKQQQNGQKSNNEPRYEPINGNSFVTVPNKDSINSRFSKQNEADEILNGYLIYSVKMCSKEHKIVSQYMWNILICRQRLKRLLQPMFVKSGHKSQRKRTEMLTPEKLCYNNIDFCRNCVCIVNQIFLLIGNTSKKDDSLSIARGYINYEDSIQELHHMDNNNRINLGNLLVTDVTAVPQRIANDFQQIEKSTLNVVPGKHAIENRNEDKISSGKSVPIKSKRKLGRRVSLSAAKSIDFSDGSDVLLTVTSPRKDKAFRYYDKTGTIHLNRMTDFDSQGTELHNMQNKYDFDQLATMEQRLSEYNRVKRSAAAASDILLNSNGSSSQYSTTESDPRNFATNVTESVTRHDENNAATDNRESKLTENFNKIELTTDKKLQNESIVDRSLTEEKGELYMRAQGVFMGLVDHRDGPRQWEGSDDRQGGDTFYVESSGTVQPPNNLQNTQTPNTEVDTTEEEHFIYPDVTTENPETETPHVVYIHIPVDPGDSLYVPDPRDDPMPEVGAASDGDNPDTSSTSKSSVVGGTAYPESPEIDFNPDEQPESGNGSTFDVSRELDTVFKNGYNGTDFGYSNFDEPAPMWPTAKEEWKIAWEIHIYTVGILSAVIAIFSFTSAIRLVKRRNLLSKGYFLSLNILLVCFGTMRAVYFLVDAYNSNRTFHLVISWMLWTLPYSCLTSAFSVLFLALLQTTKMQVISPRIQRPSILAAVICFHFVLTIATDFAVGFFITADDMFFVCQIVFVLWGASLSVGYMYIFRKLYISARHQQRESFKLSPNPSRKMPKLALNLAIKITLVTAVFGAILVSFQIYGMAGVFSLLRDKTPDPWPWWVYQFGQRLTELGMAFTMSYVSTQPFRYKTSKRKSCHNEIMLIFPCCRVLESDNYDEHENYYTDELSSQIQQRPHIFTTPIMKIRTPELTTHSPLLRCPLATVELDFIDKGEVNLAWRMKDTTLESCTSQTSRPSSMLVSEQGYIRFRTESDAYKDAEAVVLTDDELGSCSNIAENTTSVYHPCSKANISPDECHLSSEMLHKSASADSPLVQNKKSSLHACASLPNTGANTPATPRSFLSADPESDFSSGMFSFNAPSSIHLRDSIDRALDYKNFTLKSPCLTDTPESLSGPSTPEHNPCKDNQCTQDTEQDNVQSDISRTSSYHSVK